MSHIECLEALSFGQPVAEEEREELAKYFVTTAHWRRLVADEVDVFFGAKGSGKSALYALLSERAASLRERGIEVIAGENPRGATAFAQLRKGETPTERELEEMWRLYLLALIAERLRELGAEDADAKLVVRAVEQAGLIPYEKNLAGLVKAVRDWVGAHARPRTVETGLEIDPASGMPTGMTTSISLDEPSAAERDGGAVSLQTLLVKADRAARFAGAKIWVALDRLDVAFAGASELERNGLRALLRVYLDLRGLKHLELKIFLRSDIGARLMEGGFVEASHVVRQTTIKWDPASLLVNLVARRALVNNEVVERYGVDPSATLANFSEQERLLELMLPAVTTDEGERSGFDWMMDNCRNGSPTPAPREIIHFLDALRHAQIQRLEVGHDEPAEGRLFDVDAFPVALAHVSKARLEQTLYAEYEKVRPYVSRLEGGTWRLSSEDLMKVWRTSRNEMEPIAENLVDVGLFERDAARAIHECWTVSPIYRPALRLRSPDNDA